MKKIILNLYGESKITRIETREEDKLPSLEELFIWRIQDNKD